MKSEGRWSPRSFLEVKTKEGWVKATFWSYSATYRLASPNQYRKCHSLDASRTQLWYHLPNDTVYVTEDTEHVGIIYYAPEKGQPYIRTKDGKFQKARYTEGKYIWSGPKYDTILWNLRPPFAVDILV